MQWPGLNKDAPLARELRNHHALSGLLCSAGVLLITVLTWLAFGTQVAIPVSAGALIVSLTDIAVPRRNKLPLLLANLVQMPLVSLAVLLSHDSVWLLGAVVLLIAFASAMATAWGRAGLPLGYGMTMVMAFSLALPELPVEQQMMHVLQECAGGMLYLGYGLLMARAVDVDMRRRVLVDAMHAFADYMNDKARLFDPAIPIDQVYADLVRRQAVLAEKLQTARDFLLDERRTPERQAMADGLFAMIDAHEAVLASQGDYSPLRDAFREHRVLGLLADMTRAAAKDVIRIAESDLSSREPVLTEAPYRAMRPALAHAVDTLRQQQPPADDIALASLLAARQKIFDTVDALRRVDRVLRDPAPKKVSVMAMGRFLSRSSFAPRALWLALRMDSPVLRYAIRLTLAMAAAYLLSRWLPWAGHGYWILLTVSLVMRASFSQTRQRQTDRMIGNALGCLFVAALLRFVPQPVVLLSVIFISIGIAHTFLTVRYRVTVTAMCVMALLQLHLIAPGSFHVSERFLDTLAGVAIAWAFSRVLPSWERNSVPALVRRLQQSLVEYIERALTPGTRDVNYRLARRHAQEALAALSDAAARMVNEPSSKQLPLATLNILTTRGYLLLAHVAAARRLGAQGDSAAAALALEQARVDLRNALGTGIVFAVGHESDALRRRLDAAREDAQAIMSAARELLAPTSSVQAPAAPAARRADSS
ncbi:FUSC family protein [Methyloversatilis thermotolerans]|uniref:FUSC family protein n=1 Tax=Methyloversatilis thermotolerans TaxID=1346290 RepID=UPI000382861B|nr:FUSC family membrane protein [Methyloversatilis thermotolerans]